MASVFFRSVAAGQKVADENRADGLFLAVGNTGNMLFELALERQLAPDVERLWDVEDIPAGLETLILSMSNFISPASDLTKISDAIEAKKVERIVMIGCGAQADGFDVSSFVFTRGTRRFLDLLRERSRTIGVRGAYTASVLDDLGFDNLATIGCPSIYWPMEQGWGDFRPPEQDGPRSYGTHCTPTGKYRDSVGNLFAYGQKHDMYYLCQTEIDYFAEKRHPDFDYYMMSTERAHVIHEWMRRRARIFFDLDEWIRFNEGLSFVLGSRFHGNVVTMLAGRPALNMTFDTRTREMIDHYNLPYIDFADFDPELPIEHYLEQANYDYFRSTYRARLVEYVDFLDTNGVDHLIGADLKACVAAHGPLDPARRRLADAMVRDALLAGIPRDVFARRLAQALKPDRDATTRNAVEVGVFGDSAVS